jgi:LmbE family N-acetylglucosaminyl deacetylase
MEDSVLFLCAHNDDQVIGAGGTIAKYAKEGKKVVTVIFSYGEFSLPHLQEKITRRTRVIESKKAAKLLGESEIYYLALKEGEFGKEIQNKDILTKVMIILKRVNPSKIFTHSLDDPHSDHRQVYAFTMNLIEKANYKGEVYSFNVWNLFLNFRKRNNPKLVVDISSTFSKKIEAFKKHKSQWMSIVSHMWSIYFQAIINGFDNHMKYAEVFYRVK